MKVRLFLVCATLIALTSACAPQATFQTTAGTTLTASPQAYFTAAVTVTASGSMTSATQKTPDFHKLSPRLTLLVQSPALLSASPEDQAIALSLPAQGPGSLIRDGQNRLQVTMRVTDTSEAALAELTQAGAVIISSSKPYQEVTAWVSVVNLAELSSLPQVLSVTEDLMPGTGGGGG